MNDTTLAFKNVTQISEHIVEVISDSGEGAQRCGQSLGSIAARMGIGIWTVEIIPAEIRPPARSVAGASGNRIRLGAGRVTNGGDLTNLVVAFNEQVLLGRVRDGELAPDCTILLESLWREHNDPSIRQSYEKTLESLRAAGYRVIEIPMARECAAVANAERGKNMFALGMLCSIYSLELKLAQEQIALTFGKKAQKVIDTNVKLLDAGYRWAEAHLDFKYRIPAERPKEAQIVVNGNTALALGVLASGMEICAMYPITPATSASHYLSDVFEKVGGVVHQAEDEISACAFAIGASYAGKCTVTITSGPGYSLKQEAIGLAVMSEIPLVVVNVQRGGPSTGQPTKAEQGDLMTAIYGSHGDAPKVVMAASTIEDCFYSVITARRIAETFNMVVVVLTDANLATSQQPFPRPQFDPAWMAPPIDQSAVPEGLEPYDWDAATGLARRFIPGQPNGMHALTGLAHDRASHVAYDPEINEESIHFRSLKLAALQRTLKAPALFGPAKGEMLVIGWGSTKGAIEEAVETLQGEGRKVSSMHLRFLQPLPPGIKEAMKGFKQVMTIEGNWSDRPEDQLIDETNRRYSALAMLLRARYLRDIDCYSEVRGQPIKPATICEVVRRKLGKPKKT
ncbi:MAG: 2-oxoglutarate oxidoreductase [Betaproteobacteria bacterium RIFCSPLOWO2_12_FULL_65_14]|nr:MAG: 2-oxoglutarate oxidoreductase [Betaproteobacteria bacterium RIFCSPLOWO2_12_FULL_65_14]